MFNVKTFLSITALLIALFSGCADNTMKPNQRALDSQAVAINDLNLGANHTLMKASGHSSVQPLYFNRHLTYNLLRNIFGSSINDSVSKDIGWASNDFGASFSLYQNIAMTNENCKKSTSTFYKCVVESPDVQSLPNLGVSAPREARRLIACQRAVNHNNAIAFAFNRIEKDSTLDSPPKATMKNYQRVYQLFFRGRPLPPAAVFDNFQLIMTREKNRRTGWKKILLSVCLSPHWQVM